MEPALRSSAESILAQLPAALEMPAGTGKTHLVAAIAAIAEEQGKRVLVLTHTHAGIDAIRGRLRAFGVSPSNVHIDTITGWAFDLARSYPDIAEVSVPPEPDWTKSADYVAGATKVAQARVAREMHEISFDYFIVDEYQDCNENQHSLILAIANAVPKTCVLGDRLQGIFDFGSEHLVDWDVHVFPHFPLYPQTHEPHRWHGHNEELGQWLLSLRPTLLGNAALDLSVGPPGYRWRLRNATDSSGFITAALATYVVGESVLVLGQWKPDTDALARDLRGVYSVMEDIQGQFMLEFLAKIDSAPTNQYAALVVGFAKSCFIGLSGFNAKVIEKLETGKTVGHLTRAGLQGPLRALDSLIASPTLDALAETMKAIEAASGPKLFKREAWIDVRKSIEASSVSALPTVTSLARIRDALRHSGRFLSKRVVSRTVLVKGLEYDHVIIANAAILKNRRNLYVALSRARKSLTVFSTSQRLNY